MLIVNVADHNASENHAIYDLNAAVQHMIFQTEEMGLKGRVFISFDKDAVAKEFNLADGLQPYSMTAIGVPAADAVKPERERKPISEIRIG